MSKDRDGGPTFPTSISVPQEPYYSGPESSGMSLRDHFAAQALIALCTRGAVPSEAAHLAYAYADAMLNERTR